MTKITNWLTMEKRDYYQGKMCYNN